MNPAVPVPTRRLSADARAVLLLPLVLFLVLAGFAPGFATAGNLGNLVVAGLPLLVLATGQTVVLITGGIDLSVTAVIGLTSVLGALVMSGDAGWLRGNPAATPVALAVMLGTGATVGLLNGTCVAWLRMPAFMVTLTTTLFMGGLAVWLAQRQVHAESIYNLPAAFLLLGNRPTLAAGVAIAAAVATHLLLTRTLLGRWFQAVGYNSRTALISGVPVGATVVTAYVLSGLMASLTSILITARLETGSPSHGRTLLLDVIGAAVIGGTSLFGGKGTVPGTAAGVLFLALLSNGLNQLNLSDFFITMVKGAVILMAALMDVRRNRWARES